MKIELYLRKKEVNDQVIVEYKEEKKKYPTIYNSDDFMGKIQLKKINI